VLFGKPPRIRPAEGSTARLRGTVALVLQSQFGASATAAAAEAAVSVAGRIR
jgi:hypothetical protein